MLIIDKMSTLPWIGEVV